MRIVHDAIAESSLLAQLFFTEEAFEKYSEEISQADLREVKTLIVSNELGARMSATEKTQGIFAICRKPIKRNVSEAVVSGGRYIVLYQLQDPGNLGMIIRTADAMGVDGIIMSECCDLFSPKAIRSTMGSVFRTNILNDCNITEIFSAFKKVGIASYAAVIDKDAQDVLECGFAQGSAVFIGNEGNGIPKEIVALCDKKITIKMQGNINSLNAAMAAGIITWEMMRKK